MNSRKSPTRELEQLFSNKKIWHANQRSLPIKEKVRILLQLQKQDLPLLKRQRRLEWWERPWPIDP